MNSLDDVKREAILIHGQEDVDAAITRMAGQINEALRDEGQINALLVMNGALFFAAQLTKQLDLDLVFDHCHASRYRGKTEGDQLNWGSRPAQNMDGRCVLLIDDILDEGHTLIAIRDYCLAQGARHVYTAVLVDKHHQRREPEIPSADFTGLSVADHYVFGFGMDYKEHFRHWPGIYRLP